MPGYEKARQESDSDISDDIILIHWTGAIDSSWEPANSVIKDMVPRTDDSGCMVVPLTLLERGRYHPEPSLRSEAFDIPMPRPQRIIVIDDRRRNGSTAPRSPQRLKADVYEEWEHFFLCYPWAFRRPADESILLPFEREYFRRRKMRQRR